MMLGEYDFGDTFTANKIRISAVMTSDNNFTKMIFPYIVQAFFIAMIFLGSIIIANLITGLTIFNIRELYKEAEVFKLGSSVQQIINVENMVEKSKIFHFAKRLMPSIFGKTSVFGKLALEGKSNAMLTVCIRPNELGTHDDSLVRLTSSKELTVYLYDCIQHHVGPSLHMSIPISIVKDTFAQLEKTDKLQRELRETLRTEEGRAKLLSGASEEDIYWETGRSNRSRKITISETLQEEARGGSNESMTGGIKTPTLHRLLQGQESRYKRETLHKLQPLFFLPGRIL